MYASPVHTSSTRAPGRMGAIAASLRSVSSMGSTPTPNLCMENPASKAVGAKPPPTGISDAARPVSSENTWKRDARAPRRKTYAPFESAATSATSDHVAIGRSIIITIIIIIIIIIIRVRSLSVRHRRRV